MHRGPRRPGAEHRPRPAGPDAGADEPANAGADGGLSGSASSELSVFLRFGSVLGAGRPHSYAGRAGPLGRAAHPAWACGSVGRLRPAAVGPCPAAPQAGPWPGAGSQKELAHRKKTLVGLARHKRGSHRCHAGVHPVAAIGFRGRLHPPAGGECLPPDARSAGGGTGGRAKTPPGVQHRPDDQPQRPAVHLPGGQPVGRPAHRSGHHHPGLGHYLHPHGYALAFPSSCHGPAPRPPVRRFFPGGGADGQRPCRR